MKGDQGEPGPPGEQGDKGATGESGPKGRQGMIKNTFDNSFSQQANACFSSPQFLLMILAS